jgi:hypothetical protein
MQEKAMLAIRALSMSALISIPCAPWAVAQSDDTGSSALLDELRALREQNARIEAANAELAAKVANLEQRVVADGTWLSEQRAAEIRAVVHDVLSDSAARDSLAADGAMAGYDATRGFFLASADGNYSLRIRGNLQYRWTYSSRDIGAGTAASGSPSSTTEEDEWGFEFRRVQFMFGGNMIDTSWTYFLQIQAARAATLGSNLVLNDGYVEKDLGNGFVLRGGQFKSPFLREELVGASQLTAVERSLVNELFTTARAQGLQIEWKDELWRLNAWYGDEQRANASEPFATNSSGDPEALNAAAARPVGGSQNSAFTQFPTDYSFTGRLEWKPAGDWRQFRDLASFRGGEFGALFGLAGYAQQLRTVAQSNGASPDVMWSVTGDLSLEFGGASLFVMGVYRGVNLQESQPVRGGGESDTLNQWGALAQVGWFFVDDAQLFASYEIGNTDTDQYRVSPTALRATGEELNLLTVGVVWWPEGVKNPQVKWTTDFGYSFDPLVDFAAGGAGWLPDYTEADGTTRDGQWVVRSQLQFLF